MKTKQMETKYFKYVLRLAVFTILYNIIEGLVAVWIGTEDEVLTLFGFGIDSFIEVISGLGILQMILRIRKNPKKNRSHFEITALKITGWGFYILSSGLLIGAILNLHQKHKPETSFWGIVISIISIMVMLWLYKSKIYYGKKLESEPIIADGRCTLVCIYMSLILLISSMIYEFTGFGWADTLGAIGLAYFSYTEGKEAFEKVRNKRACCSHC